MSELPHFDSQGHSQMVDVGDKPMTKRTALASGTIKMQEATLEMIRSQSFQKGDVLEVARLAAITATKRTSDLIPLCHPIRLTSVNVEFRMVDSTTIRAEASVNAFDRTGVEMESLTAVSAGLLTIYDMCKSVDRGMKIECIQLEEKLGGKSGHYRRAAD